MENAGAKKGEGKGVASANSQTSGSVKSDVASAPAVGLQSSSSMQFIFTYNGRTIDSDETPEEAGVEEGFKAM